MTLLTERTKAVQAQCNDKSCRPLPNYPVKFYSSQELRDRYISSPAGYPQSSKAEWSPLQLRGLLL